MQAAQGHHCPDFPVPPELPSLSALDSGRTSSAQPAPTVTPGPGGTLPLTTATPAPGATATPGTTATPPPAATSTPAATATPGG
jgi:hypothetical protein